MTDFPDWQAPQAHANAISTTGAPPLVFERILNLNFGQAIAAGATFTVPASGMLAVNQPAYEIGLFCATAAVTAPIVSVELQWYDTFSSFLVDTEIYYFYSGDINNHLIHGRGPSKADGLIMIITNHAGTGAVTVGWNLMQTSRTFTREFWKTIAKSGVPPVFPGFTAATHDIGAGILCGQAVSVPANTVSKFVLPLYTGTVRLFGTTSSAVAANNSWNVLAITDLIISGGQLLQVANGQTGNSPFGVSSAYLPDTPLPRAQCQLQNVNLPAGIQTMSTAIVAQEDRS